MQFAKVLDMPNNPYLSTGLMLDFSAKSIKHFTSR